MYYIADSCRSTTDLFAAVDSYFNIQQNGPADPRTENEASGGPCPSR